MQAKRRDYACIYDRLLTFYGGMENMNDTKKRGARRNAEKAAEKVVAEVREEAAKVVEGAKPAVDKAKAGVREGAKTARKKAIKTVAKAKTGVKRAADKAVRGETAPVVYVQYQDAEEKVEDLVAAAKAAFASEHPRTKVADLKLYVKPEERAAYYVVNEKFAGRVDF